MADANKPSPLEVVREGFFQTLGKIAVTRDAAENAVSRTVSRLVELGKLTQEEATKFTGEIKGRIERNRSELERRIDEGVSQAMSAVRFPKREELDTLRERVVQLEKMIEQVESKKAPH